MTTDLDRHVDLLAMIKGGELPDEIPSEEIVHSIVQQILAADTEEQIFEAGGSTACIALLDSVIEVKDVRLMRSEIDGAWPVYMLLMVTHVDSQVDMVLNTGSARIMAQAWRARELGLLPKRLKITAVSKAKPGQSPAIGLAIV